MEWGLVDIRDLIILVVSVVIVAAIALFLHQPVLGEEASSNQGIALPETIPPSTTAPQATSTLSSPEVECPTGEPSDDGGELSEQKNAHPASIRIRYTDDIRGYPRHILPSNLNIYGVSDPFWRELSTFQFAYIQESSGGLTRTFNVPYPLWRMNVTIQALIKPQYAELRWALVNMETGAIIEGGELRNSGSMIKNIHISNTPMYIIISTRDVDMVTISLEAPDVNSRLYG